MSIKLPQEITYFYEITQVMDRLYYCIPQKQLHSMAQRNMVSRNIIKDYPDGVDIKVSPIQFKEFQVCYGMTFNMEPQLIWKAFQFVKSKMKKKYFGTGFIKHRFLEDIAKQIQLDFNQIIVQPSKVDLEPATIKNQKSAQRKKRLSVQRLDKRLKQLSIRDIDPNKSIIKQSFSKIKMSKGDEPFDFFSRYYLKPKGGK
ncbi:MAG: hypothetical protein KAS53_03735 [Candidatus Cloacimonetes bacterium]|nr:hypothetical protein [Candidatus Cloacimonadota bacterium]